MKRSRILLSVPFVVAALAVAAWFALSSETQQPVEAQQRGSGQLRIAVVDFTRLSGNLQDVEKIRVLMNLLRELQQVEERRWQQRINRHEQEIEALQRFELRADLEREEAQLREALASYEAVRQVIEFRMKKMSTMFSSRLLQKILERIQLFSEGTYDLVFKVLGDPTGEQAVGEDLVGEAQKLNLARAREILYYSRNSEHVSDITEHVRRHVNTPGGTNDVSRALDEAIAQVRAEIEEARRD